MFYNGSPGSLLSRIQMGHFIYLVYKVLQKIKRCTKIQFKSKISRVPSHIITIFYLRYSEI